MHRRWRADQGKAGQFDSQRRDEEMAMDQVGLYLFDERANTHHDEGKIPEMANPQRSVNDPAFLEVCCKLSRLTQDNDLKPNRFAWHVIEQCIQVAVSVSGLQHIHHLDRAVVV
jgi:hypothetical protein